MASKPLAIGLVRDLRNQGPASEVHVTKSRAAAAAANGATHYAPGWRPMAFRSAESAKAKLEKHPGFVGWKDTGSGKDAKGHGSNPRAPRDT